MLAAGAKVWFDEPVGDGERDILRGKLSKMSRSDVAKLKSETASGSGSTRSRKKK